MLGACCRCGTLTRMGGICPHCGNACGSSRTLSAAALAIGLSLAGCNGAKDSGQDSQVQALYGSAMTDVDGDGHAPVSEGGDDCDDNSQDIYPGATETPGDGVDSNCDGSDDT